MLKLELKTSARVEDIWDTWLDVKNWPRWDQELWAAGGRNDRAGAWGWIWPRGAPPCVFRVRDFAPPQTYSLDIHLLPFLAKMRVRRVVSQGGSTGFVRFSHSVEFKGFLGFIFRYVIGPKIQRALHQALPLLREIAEHRMLKDASQKSSIVIRPIDKEDNPAVAQIIREVMPQYGAVGPGYAINDPEVDTMYENYRGPDRAFYVIEETHSGVLFGCGGYAPLTGGESGVCELRKMYFLRPLRGLGWGTRLMSLCLEGAQQSGYHSVYLETLANMKEAQKLYERSGFKRISRPRGETGHHGCNTFYLLELGSESRTTTSNPSSPP